VPLIESHGDHAPIRDMVTYAPEGERVERQPYYYVPDGNGSYYREDAVIGCTVAGRIGPFEATRTVTYGAWSLDPGDEMARG
jgi:hypothetical protein